MSTHTTTHATCTFTVQSWNEDAFSEESGGLEHIGADDGTAARAGVTILPGSGTGELTGLRGSGAMLATREGNFSMTLDYELGDHA